MSQASATENTATPPVKKSKINGQPKPGRAITDPKEIAQLVLMRIDHVNAQNDEFTIAVKSLADTARQLATVYAKTADANCTACRKTGRTLEG